MTLNPVPIPLKDIIATQPREEYVQRNEIDPRAGILTDTWIRYFTDLALTTSEQARRIESKSYTAQAAGIDSTTLLVAESTGIYRVTWYAGITTRDGVSSSVQATLSWNDGTTALKLFSFPAITADLTTTAESGSMLMLVDAASQVAFEVLYASTTPGLMTYNFGIVIERVQA